MWRFPAAKIYSYEPVPELFHDLQHKFGGHPNVVLSQVGVSNTDRQATFVVGGNHGEGSGEGNASAWGQTITVSLRDASALLSEVQSAAGKVPDAVSINCEGCEYDVLGRMVETGWLGRVPFVQLSWHDVNIPHRLAKRCAIEKVLWERFVCFSITYSFGLTFILQCAAFPWRDTPRSKTYFREDGCSACDARQCSDEGEQASMLRSYSLQGHKHKRK
mmetsp:Transcript_73206/g.185437  ORF Transcript_73206/g.185437 Transcript_73206/m.185437 type:complete len:218 (+) Transcript_73206:206-859(+)